jgi:hypothetical protein
MHLEPSRLVVLGICAALGCGPGSKKSPGSAPASASRPASPPADASAPASATAASSQAVTDAALSLLEPAGDRCEWVRLEPVSGERELLAAVPGACAGGRIAFRPDGARALLWFGPGSEGFAYSTTFSAPPGFPEAPRPASLPGTPSERLYEVDLSSGKVQPLPLPSPGALTEVAYNTKAEALAFTMQEPVPGSKDFLEFGGKRYPISPETEGLPVLVHASRLGPGSSWEIIETRASGSGSDYAPGVGILDAHLDLGRQTEEMLSPHPAGDELTDPALLAKLKALAPKLVHGDGGQWIRLKTPTVLVWEVEIEFVFATGEVYFVDGEALQRPPGLGFTNGDLIAPMLRGDYLLIAADTVGTHPRLYDLRRRALVYSSDTARATTFSPR